MGWDGMGTCDIIKVLMGGMGQDSDTLFLFLLYILEVHCVTEK